MYRSGKVSGGLSQSQLQAARLGFLKYLRRRRLSEEFIDNHGDDLFSIATVEYTRKLREGVEIERPGGWLIDCAWKRTKSFLEAAPTEPRLGRESRGAAPRRRHANSRSHGPRGGPNSQGPRGRRTALRRSAALPRSRIFRGDGSTGDGSSARLASFTSAALP
jgi:hypothetical protein